MIAWVLWFFIALHVFLLDGILADHVSMGGQPFLPDLTLAVALFCGLYARPTALPGLLVCAALSRSVLGEGSTSWHLLVLGIPVAVLLPLRVMFFRGSVLWPCVASGFLAFAMPRLSGLLHRVTGDGVPAMTLSGLQIFLAMCLVPLITWAIRSLPPLSLFQEDRS